MIKGTNKRVVVVKSPDQKLFEQAIFIVRDPGIADGGDVDILKEAERVANEYLSGAAGPGRGLLRRVPPLGFALIGAVLSCAVWVVLRLCGI